VLSSVGVYRQSFVFGIFEDSFELLIGRLFHLNWVVSEMRRFAIRISPEPIVRHLVVFKPPPDARHVLPGHRREDYFLLGHGNLLTQNETYVWPANDNLDKTIIRFGGNYPPTLAAARQLPDAFTLSMIGAHQQADGRVDGSA
jgi:hypothetical protein